MTRLRPLALAIVLLVLAAPAGVAAGASVCATSCFQAPAGSGALLVFSGHGWGHGVGMSQYGAYGFAQHGASYDQILAHYYPGTTLGPAPAKTIRVLLADRKKKVTIAADARFTVRDGDGGRHVVAAGKHTYTADLDWPLSPACEPAENAALIRAMLEGTEMVPTRIAEQVAALRLLATN